MYKQERLMYTSTSQAVYLIVRHTLTPTRLTSVRYLKLTPLGHQSLAPPVRYLTLSPAVHVIDSSEVHHITPVRYLSLTPVRYMTFLL